MQHDRLAYVAATLVGVMAAVCCTVSTFPVQLNSSTTQSAIIYATTAGLSSSPSSWQRIAALDQSALRLPNKQLMFGDTPSGTTRLDAPRHDGGDEEDKPPTSPSLCPSYCDPSGRWFGRAWCTETSPFCCKVLSNGKLTGVQCCDVNEDEIDDDIKDGLNCDGPAWWSTVMGVCIPIGSVCFIGIIVLCTYQHRARLRRPLVLAHGVFCWTSSSTVGDDEPPHARRTSECSSTCSGSSAASHNRNFATPTAIRVNRQSESLDISTNLNGSDMEPVQSRSARTSNSVPRSSTDGGIQLEFMESTEPSVADNGIELPSVFFIEILPPAYEAPPNYNELFPASPT